MDLQRVVFGSLTCLAVAATLAGLVKSGRARYCLSFVAYLTALLTCEALTVLWPADFFVAQFYLRKQTLYDVLRTVVALEMAWRVVRSFPGALRTARWSSLVLLVGAIAVIASGPHRSSYAAIFDWQPRVVASTALLFTLTALLVAWYHLPIRAIHRAIMGGFAIYAAFFTTVLSLLQRWGWEIRWLTNAIEGTVLLGVITWWMLTAWARKEEVMPAGDELRASVEKGMPQPEERAA